AREETEFTCGGEAHIARPLEPEKLSDAAWGDYVFMRKNPKGVHYERWNHARGCRRWFNVARHTLTHQILAVYRMGDPPPAVTKGTARPIACGAAAPSPARSRPASPSTAAAIAATGATRWFRPCWRTVSRSSGAASSPPARAAS